MLLWKGKHAVKLFANSRQGIGKVLRYLGKADAPMVVVEATGGHEDALLEACCDAEIWITRVNPRQARAFAQAAGDLAKIDAIDARVLASMGSLFLGRLRRYDAPASWQRQSCDGLRRRGQVIVTLQAQKQQLALTPAPTPVRQGMARTITVIKRELAAIDDAIAKLIKTHGTPAIHSCKGLRPISQASSLALLPELGKLDCRQIARLVGVAPINHDSGQSRGKRHIRGGRAPVRVALYRATLSAVRWDPLMKAHYQQLRARGKRGESEILCVSRLL